MGSRSMYGRMLRTLALPLGDRIRGLPIGRVLSFLEESQWWPAAKLREFQDGKLRALVASCYENVPHYREVMDERGLRPSDIRGADDLHKLPLLTKQDIRKGYPERIVSRTAPRDRLVTKRTSGSTGEPMPYTLSVEARTWDRAAFYRFVRWAGSERGEWTFMVWGGGVLSPTFEERLKGLKVRLITREMSLDAYNLNRPAVRAFIGAMWKRRPPLLRGYTSGLLEMGDIMRQEGLQAPPLTAIMTTAELVTPDQRKALEAQFRAPLFDQYGCGELGGIASECSQHAGMHITSEHCIVEIVDDAGRPVPPGTVGRVALTQLDNEVMPFIRYVNGDEAALLDKACSCGRQLPLMSAVEGRTSDVILGLNGTRAYAVFFAEVLYELGWFVNLPVIAYQFVQTHRDRVRFDLVSGRPPTPVEIEAMTRLVHQRLGPMHIDLRQLQSIDRGPNGKRRFTRREWDPALEVTAESTS